MRQCNSLLTHWCVCSLRSAVWRNRHVSSRSDAGHAAYYNMLYDSRPQCISVLSLKVVQRTRGALECDGCYTVAISRLIEKPQTSPWWQAQRWERLTTCCRSDRHSTRLEAQLALLRQGAADGGFYVLRFYSVPIEHIDHTHAERQQDLIAFPVTCLFPEGLGRGPYELPNF